MVNTPISKIPEQVLLVFDIEWKGLSGYQINIAPNTIFHIQTGGSHLLSLL